MEQSTSKLFFFQKRVTKKSDDARWKVVGIVLTSNNFVQLRQVTG